MTATTTTTTDTKLVAQPGDVTITTGATHEPAWSAYVQSHADSTLFHQPLWCKVVANVFGHSQKTLIAWQDGQVVGVLPLVEMYSPFAGRMLISTPYAPYGDALANNEQVAQQLLSEAQALRDQISARVLVLRSRTVAVPDAAIDSRYCCFIKRLPVDLKGLETFLPRKARAAARQARKREGLTIRHDSHQLSIVYKLYTRSMRRLGSLNFPFAFFRNLQEQLAHRCWVSLVEHEGTPIAGVISFVDGDTIRPYVIGVDERVRCTGATNLLYYGIMERAVKAQLSFFDFGRTRKDNTGPFAFKQNQGFKPKPLAYQHLPAPGVAAPDLSPSNPRFAIARRVWPSLPLAVTQPLGAWLSRSVPG